MTRKIQVHQVDAFTRTPFTGNPAGVVLNADGLSDAEMLVDRARAQQRGHGVHDVARGRRSRRARCGSSRRAWKRVSSATRRSPRTTCSRAAAARREQRAAEIQSRHRGHRGSRHRTTTRRIAVRQSRPPLGRELNDRERLAVLDALALATRRSRSALSDAHRRRRQHASDRRRARARAAQAAQARSEPADDALRAAGRGGLFRLHARRRKVAITSPNRACSARRSAFRRIRSAATRTACSACISPSTSCCASRPRARVNFSGAQGHYVHRAGRVDVELEMKDGAVDGVWIVGQAVSIFETEIVLA